MIIQTRGLLRFAAGDRDGGISDLRHAGAATTQLGFGHSFGCAWRSMLALMLDPSERDEALALIQRRIRRSAPRREAQTDGGRAARIGAYSIRTETPASRIVEEAVKRSSVELRPGSNMHVCHLNSAPPNAEQDERAKLAVPLREGLDLSHPLWRSPISPDRARGELAATGAHPRRATAAPAAKRLTPSELRAAQMAADGQHEPGDRPKSLFVTTKTIDTHLSHTYSKLGINSRVASARPLTR